MTLDLTAELDVSTDFETVCDWLEAVTLTLPDATETAVTQALRRAVTAREGGGQNPEDTEGEVLVLDTRWHLPLSEVTTAPPIGTLITSASNIWEVVLVDWQTNGNRWLCSSRKVYTVCDNAKLIVELGHYVKSAEGDAVLDWTDQRIQLTGTVSLVSERVEIRQDAQIMVKSYVAFLMTDLNFEGPMRIVDEDEVKYNVLAGTGRRQIGFVQRLECEREEMGR